MTKNEYRRALIMLRAAVPGCSGHVRLEQRTLMASMYFIANVPDDNQALRAALVGRDRTGYYAAPVGMLQRDRRGQATLAWNFDPRAVDGRPLGAYVWVAIARVSEDGCQVVLTGNVEGSREMDPAALRDAVCAVFAPAPEPAADLPTPEELLQTPPAFPEADDAPPSGEASDAPMDGASDRGQVFPEESDKPAVSASPSPSAADVPPDPLPPAEPDQAPTDTGTSGASSDSAAAEPPSPPARQSQTRIFTALTPQDSAGDAASPSPETATARQSAADALGLDITRPWPQAAEPLHRLFATQLPAEADGEEGDVYVRAPLPEGCGFPESLIGLRAEGGMPVSVRYALPARRTPEPPAGLEEYSWSGDGQEGFWTLTLPLED